MSLTKEYFMEATEACPVIPAIKNDEWLEAVSYTHLDVYKRQI